MLALIFQNPVRIPGPGGKGATPPPTKAFVQKYDTFHNGSGASQTFPFPSNIGVGNAIAFMVTFSSGSNITSTLDGNSTAYTNTPWAGGDTICDWSGTKTRFFHLANSVGGANPKTITINFDVAPQFVWFMGEEVSGVSATNPVDKLDCDGEALAMAPSSPPLTPTNNGSYLFSMVADLNANGRTYTAGVTPPYIRDGSSGNTTQNEEHFIQTTATEVTGNWTVNDSINSVTALVVLQ